jgi:hypothetical protein
MRAMASRRLWVAVGAALLGAGPAMAKAAERGQACGPTCLTFAKPRAAFEAVLEKQPAILGLGEVHELEGRRKVPSAIKRFTRELLGSLKGKATALVVETWMTTGQCGEVEKKATAEVKKETERPASTEDEVTTLLGKAHDLGVAPHILTLTCDEYRKLLQPDGEMDPVGTLELITAKMQEKAEELYEARQEAHGTGTVVLYGGALHNDLYPAEDSETFSFGPALAKATQGHYVELDLYVPEFIADDEDLKKEPWFAQAQKLAASGKTALFNPKPDSYVLVFPRTR